MEPVARHEALTGSRVELHVQNGERVMDARKFVAGLGVGHDRPAGDLLNPSCRQAAVDRWQGPRRGLRQRPAGVTDLGRQARVPRWAQRNSTARAVHPGLGYPHNRPVALGEAVFLLPQEAGSAVDLLGRRSGLIGPHDEVGQV